MVFLTISLADCQFVVIGMGSGLGYNHDKWFSSHLFPPLFHIAPGGYTGGRFFGVQGSGFRVQVSGFGVQGDRNLCARSLTIRVNRSPLVFNL
jgi:hypothetical protein